MSTLVNMLPAMSQLPDGLVDAWAVFDAYLGYGLDIFPFFSSLLAAWGMLFVFHSFRFLLSFGSWVMSLFVPTVRQYKG